MKINTFENFYVINNFLNKSDKIISDEKFDTKSFKRIFLLILKLFMMTIIMFMLTIILIKINQI